ncbi:MAG TPA: hypothetical protein PLJ35_08505 [Anaerolineae bacterium]|nr:hypothetical protein [Anaerolineae bacterium]HOQ98848.1 hypothetical protein [Anaerolineae bacterium]HPL27072.1 hypothetical protein [Anaerolineae bacterium]
MEKRFRSLRFISTVLKVLAWITLVGGILIGVIVFIAGLAGGLAGGQSLPAGSSAAALLGLFSGAIGGIVGGFGMVFFAFLYFIFLYAAGDAIYLALSIEENTRKTVYLMECADSLRR